MKRLFFAMAAMAAMLTSCSKDETTTAPVIERSTVTFTVNAPELATRADEGEGLLAKNLKWVIYDLSEAEGKNQISGETTFPDGSLTTTVEVNLVEGREYEAIFFAHAEGAPYKIDWTAQTMTINTQGLTANNEKYDAFFKYVERFEITEQQYSVDVKMKRPFAQLNVATIDYNDATNYPAGAMIDAATTGVEVEAYTSMNLKTGNVDKDSKQTIKYNLANKMSGKISANNVEYSWLTMNYILVNARENVGVKFYFTDVKGDNNTATYTREYTAVPVERNHKTNIIGTILTSQTDFTVTIDPGFEDPEHDYNVDTTYETVVTTVDELQEAINNATAGTNIIKLGANITTKTTRAANDPAIVISQQEGINIVIDGDGHTYDGTIYIDGNARHTGAETLTFTNINFETSEQGEVYFIDSNLTTEAGRYAHNVTIENCTFNNNNASSTVDGMRFRQAYNIRIVNCEVKDNIWALIWADGCTGITIDGVDATKDFKEGAISVGQSTNIAIKNVNIKAANSLYGVRADGTVATTLSIENSSIEAMVPVAVRKVEKPYSVALKGQNTLKATGLYDVIFTAANINNEASLNSLTAPTGKWSITGAEGLNVYPTALTEGYNASSSEQLSQAIAAGATTVNLEAGKYTFPASKNFTAETVINCEEGTVFTGNSKLDIKGATVVGATFSNPSGTAVDQTINGKFENCKFTGSNALRWCYAGETVEFVNCEFSGSVYGVHFDGGANEAIFRDCTFSGFNAFAGAITSLTLENCTFKSNGISGYNGANLWGSATLKGCKFIFDGSASYEWIDCKGADKAYSFENCTINGVDYTSDNYKSYLEYIYSSSSNEVTVKINNVDCKLAE